MPLAKSTHKETCDVKIDDEKVDSFKEVEEASPRKERVSKLDDFPAHVFLSIDTR